MDGFSKDDLDKALRTLASLLNKCEKAQQGFAPGTSQATLLKNRIHALQIAIALINNALKG